MRDYTRALLLETFAPTSVLVNRKYQILYYHGPVSRYLDQPAGEPTDDLLLRAREGLRNTLRAVLHKAVKSDDKASAVVQYYQDGVSRRVRVIVMPPSVPRQTERLLLVSFLEEPEATERSAEAVADTAGSGDALVQQLERELQASYDDLQSSIEELESSNEELKAANEEIMSVNEELQSTNEELESSKEELQSLNEELSTVNSQLEEKLRELETANDNMDNLMSSTNIATVLLDRELRIKHYTPAITRLFKLIATDAGRPLGDIVRDFEDDDLLRDAGAVLERLVPLEKEVRAREHDQWYVRCIQPFRTQDNRIDGVVVTFVDITERKLAAKELQEAKDKAVRANQAKSRFFAAASHDLRQPLQVLNLINGVLARKIEDAEILKLIEDQDTSMQSIKHMLDVFLDLCRIDAGVIKPEITEFPVTELFDEIKQELAIPVGSRKRDLRVSPCSATIRSDARLLRRIRAELSLQRHQVR